MNDLPLPQKTTRPCRRTRGLAASASRGRGSGASRETVPPIAAMPGECLATPKFSVQSHRLRLALRSPSARRPGRINRLPQPHGAHRSPAEMRVTPQHSLCHSACCLSTTFHVGAAQDRKSCDRSAFPRHIFPVFPVHLGKSEKQNGAEPREPRPEEVFEKHVNLCDASSSNYQGQQMTLKSWRETPDAGPVASRSHILGQTQMKPVWGLDKIRRVIQGVGVISSGTESGLFGELEISADAEVTVDRPALINIDKPTLTFQGQFSATHK